jgi:hypothetical protein
MKKITTVMLAVVLCSATFAGISDDLYTQYYKKAVEQVSQGDLAGARDSFESALTFKPGDADAQKGIRLCDERLNKKPQSRPVTRPTREASSYTQPARSAKASNEPSGQTAISVLYFSPKDDDTYDFGLGAEAQVRFWGEEGFGWALSVGLCSWAIEDQSLSGTDGSLSVSADFDGSVLLLPLGGSVLFRPKLSDEVSLVLEGGLRYVVVNSNVDADLEVSDGSTTVFAKEEVDVENGFVGIIGANLEIEVAETTDLLVGIGYQFDLAEGDVELLDEKLGENELEAFYVRAGVAINF